MKKIFVLILVVALCCLLLCSCGSKEKDNQQTPLVLVESLSDQYDNILSQIYYNTSTNEYLLKEFIYEYVDNKWVCVEQTTTVYQTFPLYEDPCCQDTPLLNVVRHSDLIDNSITVVNNTDVKITITKILPACSWYDFGYELFIENKSDKILTAAFVDSCIMNIPCEPLFNIDHIEAHSQVKFKLVWDKTTLQTSCIPSLDDIKVTIKIFDNANYYVPAKYVTNVLIKR